MVSKRAWLWISMCLTLALVNGCDRPAGRRLGTAPIPLLVFEQQGGIAGFQDRLVVGQGGEYHLRRGRRIERIGTLAASRKAEVEGWREGFGPFTLNQEDNPGGPDSLTRQLTWAGQGQLEANEVQQHEVMDWAVRLLDELSAEED